MLILLKMSEWRLGVAYEVDYGPFDADDEDELGLIGNVVGAFLLTETG